MKEIIIATKNPDKLREIKKLLAMRNLKLKFLPQSYKSPEENGLTLKENSLIKARSVSEKFNSWGIADDTGLEIDALGGKPGVRSARFAGENCSYLDNVKKVLSLMKGIPWQKRKATFKTVVCIFSPEGKTYFTEGVCRGFITTKPKGKNGFGYDPIFYYPPSGKTFAQMSMKEKNKVSHRSRAFKKARKVISCILQGKDLKS